MREEGYLCEKRGAYAKGGVPMPCREAQTFLNDEAGGGKKVQFLDFVECELGVHACILVTPHTLLLPKRSGNYIFTSHLQHETTCHSCDMTCNRLHVCENRCCNSFDLRGRLRRCGTMASAATFRVWPHLRKKSRISQLAALSTR